MGTIIFEGHSPFSLPVLQFSKAYAEGDTVTASLYVSIDGGAPQAVQIQMLVNQAIELGAQLGACAEQALAWKSKT